jgi:hypothetical protein
VERLRPRQFELADAAEYLAPPDPRQVDWNGDLVVVVGWSLLAGLVRAVAVVMGGVVVQD